MKEKIKDDPVILELQKEIARLKDELLQHNFEIEKIWKVLLDTQKKMGELENMTRSNASLNLVQ